MGSLAVNPDCKILFILPYLLDFVKPYKIKYRPLLYSPCYTKLMQDSIFTQIIRGDIPCHKIYEDDKVIAFLDIHPQQPGHTLVIPKVQIDLLWDLPEDIYTNLWLTAQKIAKHIGSITGKRIGVHVEGNGVPHAHIHLVPFTTTEEFLQPPDMATEPDHAKLSEMANKLRIKE